MPDHLGRQLSPIGALAAAAAVTTRLRIGSFVYANDYRHPLLLAREAATLDHLSGGRLELGIGAGWNVPDYRQLGMPYDRPGLRIDRMVESLGIIKRLLAGERVTHDGPHYHLDGARLAPRPVQARVPILIGGGGPRMLRIAAREADIVGLLPQFNERGRPIFTQASEAETARKVEIVREAAGSPRGVRATGAQRPCGRWWCHRTGSSSAGSALAAAEVAGPARDRGNAVPPVWHGVARFASGSFAAASSWGSATTCCSLPLMETDGACRRGARRALIDQLSTALVAPRAASIHPTTSPTNGASRIGGAGAVELRERVGEVARVSPRELARPVHSGGSQQVDVLRVGSRRAAAARCASPS